MPFTMTLGFATAHERDAFIERIVPKTRAHLLELPEEAEQTDAQTIHKLGLSVTSPSAARDVCHQIVAFLAHAKHTRVDVWWTGPNGEEQTGDIAAGQARDAELVAVRAGSAAKTILDAEKAEAENAAPAEEAAAE